MKKTLTGPKCKCCGLARTFTVVGKLRFERHNFGEKAFMYADVSKRGTEPTIAEEIRDGQKFRRHDIFMVNLSDGSKDDEGWEQLMVYPTASGKPNFGTAKPFMTPEEIQWCHDENARILEAEKEFGLTWLR